MTIKNAGAADIEAIRHLACLTWPLAYASILSAGQINYMLRQMYSYDRLLAQMEQGDLFLLALDEDRPVGFLNVGKVNYPVPGNEKKEVWKLHKIYVLPTAQQKGVGRQLMEEAVNLVRAQSGDYLVLNVNRSNPAFRYYLKQGFQILESADVDIGQGFYMNDHIMGKVI